MGGVFRKETFIESVSSRVHAQIVWCKMLRYVHLGPCFRKMACIISRETEMRV